MNAIFKISKKFISIQWLLYTILTIRALRKPKEAPKCKNAFNTIHIMPYS